MYTHDNSFASRVLEQIPAFTNSTPRKGRRCSWVQYFGLRKIVGNLVRAASVLDALVNPLQNIEESVHRNNLFVLAWFSSPRASLFLFLWAWFDAEWSTLTDDFTSERSHLRLQCHFKYMYVNCTTNCYQSSPCSLRNKQLPIQWSADTGRMPW